MRKLYCQCGQLVFSQNTHCFNCDRVLGFDPFSRQMVSLETASDGQLQDTQGNVWQRCANRIHHSVCNGLVSAEVATTGSSLCECCALNRTIPVTKRAENKRRWHKMEFAKRRMIAGLSALGLDVRCPAGNYSATLRFDFMEDKRSHPDVLETFVSTGHKDGVITINLIEADEVKRVAARENMGERYRTLLGHMRHEVGHFFYTYLVADLNAFTALFGDPTVDYSVALQTYYDNGPAADWGNNYISAYATSHPWEDWAESFAHYLHMQDAMATASERGFIPDYSEQPIAVQIQQWTEFSVNLNEVGRSLGLGDSYPFVIAPHVADKLAFVHDSISRYKQTWSN